ncbi:MAG: thioredoxin family protein [Acidimicrobiales bacterium]|nr:thioredoxin family protein [Acidimicrobiales bacterium]
MIAVAIDENVEVVAPLAQGITYPVLVDTEHRLPELYAVNNVPTVMWIDEADRIVRPNANEFGSDMFTELTGIRCEDHMTQVRAWIRDGTLPDDASFEVPDLDADEIAARLHFRMAVHGRRSGRGDVAERHFNRAKELAPHDFTIVRAAMPLTGIDPFGPAYFELYGVFEAAGAPYRGIRRPRP